MYKINLSHAQLKAYMAFLISQDLLAHNSDGYFTTEKGHHFLEAFAWLNDVLENRAYGAFSVILKESYEEVEIAHGGRTAKSENPQAQTKVKKAAIVVLINLAYGAEKKTSEELKTEIHKALEEGLAGIPWAEIKKVIILEE